MLASSRMAIVASLIVGTTVHGEVVARYEFANTRSSTDMHTLSSAGSFTDGAGFSGSYSAAGYPGPSVEVDGAETANSEIDALSQGKYFTFTVTPNSGVLLDYQKLTFNAQAKYNTGGHTIYVSAFWSADGYSGQLGYHSETTNPGTQDSDFTDLHEFDLSSQVAQFGLVTFRIVVWDGTTWNGKAARLDNVTLTAVQRKTATVEAIEDGEIRGGTYADTVQYAGANSQIFLKMDNNTSYRCKGYAKFDLSAVDAADADEPAVLAVRYAGGGSGSGTGCWIYPYALKPGFTPGSGVLGPDWSETAITWNNAPANNKANMDFTTDAESIMGGAAWWVTYTAAVGQKFTTTIGRLGDYMQTDGTVTVLFTPRQNGTDVRQTAMTSSEHTSYPGPELTYATVLRGTVFVVK